MYCNWWDLHKSPVTCKLFWLRHNSHKLPMDMQCRICAVRFNMHKLHKSPVICQLFWPRHSYHKLSMDMQYWLHTGWVNMHTNPDVSCRLL